MVGVQSKKTAKGELSHGWRLGSGVWERNANAQGFTLSQTAFGYAPAASLSTDDLACWLQAGLASGTAAGLHPPEFRYCVDSGEELRRPAAKADGGIWIPPFGTSSLVQRAARTAMGLRQTSLSVSLSRRRERRADSDPDVTRPLPPPGDYEFFSVPAGTNVPVLLALDPSKGMLCAWLPRTQKWESMEHDGGGLLAVTRLGRPSWRCEVSQTESGCLMFLPSEEGLACVRPDAVGLVFRARYVGGEPAIGAPLRFGDQVWVPLRGRSGQLKFVSADLQGEPGEVIDLPDLPTEMGSLQAPLTDGRLAIWPAESGQLVLRKQASGAIECGFIPWPTGLHPAFEFGSPFLSRDGSLWQLCFDTAAGTYVYLQLGIERPEREPTTAPRLCTGGYNFRFAAKFRTAPWLEPEHGDDSATDEVVLPLLESTASSSVLGVKLTSTDALANVLASSERIRVELVLDDDTSQTSFHSLSVAEPWRLRFFVHEDYLWAYHPLLNRLDGWGLK